MKRRVVWSDEARSDYLAIIRHIADENPDAAERVAARIDHAGAALANFATGRPGRVTGTYERVLHHLPYIPALFFTKSLKRRFRILYRILILKASLLVRDISS